jgi:tRNA A-37 threonylcarbamoyl transferase component Bud32
VDPVGWGFHALGTFVVLRGSPGLSADLWREFAPDGRTRIRLAVDFGRLVARLHSAGLCHRDLNVYHALVHEGQVRIIDVGRVARFSRKRWIVKDLASLHASSVREGLPASTARAFLRTYLDLLERPIARRRLLAAVLRKSERIRRHVAKHAPRA